MGVYEKIGVKIKYARKAKGLKQQEFAKELNLSRASMVNIEAGKQHVTLDKIIKICEITGFKISEFIEDNGMELPERIEYISKINVDVLARLEKIPEIWLKALIKFYESVGNKTDTGESNCTIFDVSGSVACRYPKPNCYSGICENCGKAHEL
jgi:transcriptional regulator with XRE-family HTH domain